MSTAGLESGNTECFFVFECSNERLVLQSFGNLSESELVQGLGFYCSNVTLVFRNGQHPNAVFCLNVRMRYTDD